MRSPPPCWTPGLKLVPAQEAFGAGLGGARSGKTAFAEGLAEVLVIEEKRAEFEERQKQQDAFSESDYPAGAQLCSKCNTVALVMMDGCMTCLACGDSKCG